MPFHEPEVLPWSTHHVDLVVPWAFLFKNSDETNLKKIISALTAVDSVFSWHEIIYIE